MGNIELHPPRLLGNFSLKKTERITLRRVMFTHGFNNFEEKIKSNQNYTVYQDEKKPMGFTGSRKSLKDKEDNILILDIHFDRFYVRKIEGPEKLIKLIESEIPLDVKKFAPKLSEPELDALPKRVRNLLNSYRVH